ncbi:calcium/calmodulin-dependent protein kinase type IV-like [Arapaima gigas]
MPFGCLALWDRRNCNSLSDVTDKYDIGQTLRVKEFCELCLAKERETGKVFFCKKFLKKDGKKVRKAAKNEIMVLKMVSHPNILQLIDTFETRKEYFIIQELATGGDVFDWILDQGNYTERDASCVIRQVLEAVAYLHSLSIVHRNLKLESLMYYTENNHNKVVLRDFYLSRYENDGISEPCGTPEYLAPEVVARHRYGRPVDCWAMGVIMYILLSGNPPFYDDAEEDNTDQHNRIIFCRIVAGEFEFDSPYWDDISPAGGQLLPHGFTQAVTVDGEHVSFRIAGQGASEKNLKDGVCAQFKKNFAKAKWRKAIQVTTFMQRLRAPECGGGLSAPGPAARSAGEPKEDKGAATPKSATEISHRAIIENQASGEKGEERGENGEIKKADDRTHGGGVNGAITAVNSSADGSTAKPQSLSNKSVRELDTKSVQGDKGVMAAPWKTSAMEAQHAEASTAAAPDPVSGRRKSSTTVLKLEASSSKEMLQTCCAHGHSSQRMAAGTPLSLYCCVGPTTVTAPPAGQDKVAQHQMGEGERMPDVASGGWCQTQLPEAVAEKGMWTRELKDDRPEGNSSDVQGDGRHHAARTTMRREDESTYILGDKKKTRAEEQGQRSDLVHGCSPYSSAGHVISGSFRKGASGSSDWQMNSVIEEIEKQMAAVFEKIEEDMPSLLDHAGDLSEQKHRPPHLSPAPRLHVGGNASASFRPAASWSPRTSLPPHLPSHPPPTFSTYPKLVSAEGRKDDTEEPSQSPGGCVADRGL